MKIKKKNYKGICILLERSNSNWTGYFKIMDASEQMHQEIYLGNGRI